MKAVHRSVDMTQGDIGKHLISFALPMMIGLLFQQLYTTVDLFVLGQYVDQQAVAAVSSTGSIINMIVGFCSGLAIGATVVISQRYGAHDDKGLSDAVQTTIVVTVILSAVMSVVGVLVVPFALRMMDTPSDVMAGATEYLTIYFSGLTGVLFYNMGSGILRAVGDSRRPLYFLCFSALLNTALDLLCVRVFGMGVAGVAYATIFAQIISAVLVLFVLTRSNESYRIRWRALRISKPMLSQILRVGFPAAVQQGVIAFSNVFVQSYINHFGTACMSGWGNYGRIDSMIVLPMSAVSQASSTFTAQNFGAGQYERLKKGVGTAMRYSLIATAVLTLAVIPLRDTLLRIFCNPADPLYEDVMYYGGYFILMCSPFYVLCCFNQIYGGALRGMNNSRTPMIITISSFVVFRQIYLAVTKALSGSLVWVSIAYPMGWVLCSVLMTLYYRKHVKQVMSARAA